MTLKVAIVGCGKIADGHIEEIQKMPATARVVAVADLELLMAEQIATRYGIGAFYDDIDRLLATERPDVVHITTPPQSHLFLAMKAVDAGAHVYVEKPLTLTYPDSKRLVDYVRRAGKKVTIGYSYYFDPPMMTLREMVAQGALGEAVHVEAALGYNLAGPFGKAILGDGNHWVHKLPGKLIQNNLDHILYKLPEFLPDTRSDEAFEADPLGDARIMVSAWIRRSQRFGDVRDSMLDEMRVTLQSGGSSAYATFSAHVKPVGHYTRVYGTKNTAHVDHAMRTLTFESQSALPSALGRLMPAFDQGVQFLREGGRNLARFARNDFHYFTAMNTLFSRFYASITEDGPPPIAYRDILRVAAWMDEIFRQAPQDGSAPPGAAGQAPQQGRSS
jgi:predicted dehydrogenase